jgi:hypothetical protein
LHLDAGLPLVPAAGKSRSCLEALALATSGLAARPVLLIIHAGPALALLLVPGAQAADFHVRHCKGLPSDQGAEQLRVTLVDCQICARGEPASRWFFAP